MELHQSPSQYMFYLLCTFEIITPNLPCFLETHPKDDSGIPHALEHLVFQGSKNFPEKVSSLIQINLLQNTVLEFT